MLKTYMYSEIKLFFSFIHIHKFVLRKTISIEFSTVCTNSGGRVKHALWTHLRTPWEGCA